MCALVGEAQSAESEEIATLSMGISEFLSAHGVRGAPGGTAWHHACWHLALSSHHVSHNRMALPFSHVETRAHTEVQSNLLRILAEMNMFTVKIHGETVE